MKLTFLGATKTVTGSKYLLEDRGRSILIDCGLFQGVKELRLRNWEHLPINPNSVDAVVLTHAHLDHSGYLPKLVKAGFKGPIYCSKATYDLCRILLPDSGHIQEEDAERANRYGYSKHHPALPLYTQQEALDCLQYFRPVDFGQSYTLAGDLSFSLFHAGHILGAAFIRISDGGTSILFSGDIGRLHDPVMNAPAQIQEADYVVVESTYGNRQHDDVNPADLLEKIIRETTAQGGSVIIPSFAVGRAQSILYYIYILKKEGRLPPHVPVYLDSPMAVDASELLCKYPNEHRLPPGLCREVCQTATYVRTIEHSKALDGDSRMPKIIVSASGMATGGRVLHHLKHYMGDPRNTILFVGFQAAGTRGDRLTRGEKEIKIHGQMWPVRARIENLNNMSAHADFSEILSWLENFRSPPRKTFITHGESEAAAAMKRRIEERFNWNAIVPDYLQSEELI